MLLKEEDTEKDLRCCSWAWASVGEAPLESHLRKRKCIEGLGESLYFLLIRWLLGRFPRGSHLPSSNLFCVAKIKGLKGKRNAWHASNLVPHSINSPIRVKVDAQRSLANLLTSRFACLKL